VKLALAAVSLRPTHGKLLAVAWMPAVVDRYEPLLMGSMSVAW
jgi:hypothetical protein